MALTPFAVQFAEFYHRLELLRDCRFTVLALDKIPEAENNARIFILRDGMRARKTHSEH